MKKKIIGFVVFLFFLSLLAYPLFYPPLPEGVLPPERISTDEIVAGAALILLAIVLPAVAHIWRWRR